MVYTFMLHALFCVTQFNFFFLLTLDVSIFEKRLILWVLLVNNLFSRICLEVLNDSSMVNNLDQAALSSLWFK